MFGVLAVDKPAGLTSRDVVNRVQRLLRPARRGSVSPITKVGHTGTLDPMATGVLLIVVGQATKLVEYAHALRKSYEADFELGLVSDTLDSTGNVEPVQGAPHIARSAWLREMQNWQGTVEQRPPKYSAIHVGGRRAHEMARSGLEFETPVRRVTIHTLELLDFEYPRVSIRIQCSTGTYVRSLGADIATALGSSAIMTRLVRTQIGPFDLSECVRLDELDRCQAVQETLLSPLGLLTEMHKIDLDEVQCEDMRHGRTVALSCGRIGAESQEGRTVAVLDPTQKLVAIALQDQQRLRPIRVITV